MKWILDSSFTSTLFLPDEYSNLTSNFFKKNIKNKQTFHVPQIWWYELSNILTVSVNRNRLHHSDISQIILLFESLEFETDTLYGTDYLKELFEISQLYNISSYDAAFLELAIRGNSNIATYDKKLREAAKKAGIGLLSIN